MASELERAQTRRQFLKGVGALAVVTGGAAGAGVAIWRSVAGDGDGLKPSAVASPSRPGAAPTLDELADNVVSGGPGKDGIPSIDRPQFVDASAAEFLREQDPVFGLIHRGEVRAYPQIILVWHEIVNDTLAGEPLTITYCPLTGSVVAFSGTSREGEPFTFGTTGNLVNSNLLMYDRVTDSEWPQLLGIAITGTEKGKPLAELPLVWATWARWRGEHPDTLVLSPDTGFGRAYGSDPYGSYVPLDGYYERGGPFFPVMAESDRFDPKEVVIGVKAGEERLAIRKSGIELERVLPLELAGTPLLAVWDENLASARLFTRRIEGRTLRFRRGQLRDATGSTWSPAGRALDGALAGSQLPLADFLDVMWFAWYAFFPDTEVLA